MNAIQSRDVTELDSARREVDKATLRLIDLAEQLKGIITQFDDAASRLYELTRMGSRPPKVLDLLAARQAREQP